MTSPSQAYASGLSRGLSKMQMQENLRGHAFRAMDSGNEAEYARIKSFLDYLDTVPDASVIDLECVALSKAKVLL